MLTAALAGHVLFREGAIGSEFIIVIEGALRVERHGNVINQLSAGDFAGEIALVDGGPRTATVIADILSRLLLIGHREFNSLLKKTRPSSSRSCMPWPAASVPASPRLSSIRGLSNRR